MSLEADNPASPLFWLLMVAALVAAVFAWTGLLQGRLPNMRTSLRGARAAGLAALLSLGLVFVSYILYITRGELFGTVALALAGGVLLIGVTLAERIPD